MKRIVVDEIPVNCNDCPFSCMGCEIADYHREEINGCVLLVQAGDIEALRQERPKGRWVGEVIHTEIGEEHAVQECSVCGKVRIVDNYCPNCGSDNRGEEE